MPATAKKIIRLALLLLALVVFAACDQVESKVDDGKSREEVLASLDYEKVSPEESAASDVEMSEREAREARALARVNGPTCEPVADSEDDADAIGAFNYDPDTHAWSDAYGDVVGYSSDVDGDIFADESCA